jgi:hypothetical protein
MYAANLHELASDKGNSVYETFERKCHFAWAD